MDIQLKLQWYPPAATAKLSASACYSERLTRQQQGRGNVLASCNFPIHVAIWTMARGTPHGLRPCRYMDSGLREDD
ncbi:hypothetical protein ElyMa_005176600 [Elysia marginata]|uniref:Uncharacterized protein n=1 Tax=Elysia marginata TaxID=1093978 RepID=A0AAV4JQV0_9GAST|nr:hypothetical protein ElyMa_005176600 [Elysia marginata]